MSPRPLHLLLAGTALSFAAAPASAVLLVENFAYGASAITTDPLGIGTATDGWGGAWTRISAGGNTASYSTTNLSFSTAGYEPADNGGTGSITRLNNVPLYHRALAAPLAASEIWVSALIQGNRSDGTTIPRVHLVGNAGTASFGFGDSGTDVLATANVGFAGFGSTTLTSTATYDGTVHLLLARLEIDVSGSNDRLTVWLNPNVAAAATLGVAGIVGTPIVLEGIDGVGSTITAAGVSFGRNNTFIDALRISSTGGTDGLGEVLTGVAAIPEPGVAVLLAAALGACLALARRRR